MFPSFPRACIAFLVLGTMGVDGVEGLRADTVRIGQDLIAPSERPHRSGGIERQKLFRSGGKYPLRSTIEQVTRDAQGKEQVTTLQESVANHLLVTFAEGAVPTRLDQIPGFTGMATRRRIGRTATWIVSFPVQDHGTQGDMQRRLSRLPGVKAVEPDGIIHLSRIPDDPSFGGQWSLFNHFSTEADIGAPQAWEYATGNHRVVVGIIDTGIDYRHPDLVANIWKNPGECGIDAQGRDRRNNGVDDDGNGFVDDWHGWNFAGDDNDPMDDHGHGTHCAGIIGAAGDNGVGIAGVCWQVSLVGLKFLDRSGSGYVSDAIDALDYATTMGLPITSNSWGAFGVADTAMQAAIARADARGATFVCAAGNNTADIDQTPCTPGSLDNPNLISVAATTSMDELAWFSNFGVQNVDLAAPGDYILSCLPHGDYASWSGTSMACPHVAGAAALLLSVAPELTNRELKALLLDHADPLPALAGRLVSGARLDVGESLQALRDGLRLNVTGMTIADGVLTGPGAPGGNGNGLLEAGETADIVIDLMNISRDAAFQVDARLAFQEPAEGLTVLIGSCPLGDIAPGASTYAGPFRIQVAGNAQDRQVVASLQLTDAAGTRRTIPCPLLIQRIGTISGTITDLGTHASIPGSIRYEGPRSGMITVPAGSYSLADLPAGTYTLSASADGHAPSEARTITVPPDRAAVDFVLGTPSLSVTPVALSIALREDEIATHRFTITNNGNLPLQVQAAAAPAGQDPGLWHETTQPQLAQSTTWQHARAWHPRLAGPPGTGSLVFPPVFVPAANPMLTFQRWGGVDSSDQIQVDASTDGGASWQECGEPFFWKVPGAWFTCYLGLHAFGDQTVTLRIRNRQQDTGDSEGPFISDPSIAGTPLITAWSFSPAAMAIPAGGQADLTMMMRGQFLPRGDSVMEVTLTSNDPLRPSLQIPISITVSDGPRLVLTSTSLVDDPMDMDGYPESNETITCRSSFMNQGPIASGDMTGTISCSDPLVTLLDTTCVLAATASGATSITSPFRLLLAPNCPYGHEPLIHLDLTDVSGREVRSGFTFSIRWKYSVQGTVTDVDTGLPLAGVTITIENQSLVETATTDATGWYRIHGLDFGGFHHMTAHGDGHSTVRENVMIDPVDPSGGPTTWDVSMGMARVTVNPDPIVAQMRPDREATIPVVLMNPGNVPLHWNMTDGYRLVTSDDANGPAYEWIDIKDTGQALLRGAGWSAYALRGMGTTVPLFGRPCDSFYMDVDGFLLMDYNTPGTGLRRALPDPVAGLDLIAPYWGEFLMGGDSQLTTQIVDGACILQYDRMYAQDAPADPSTYQVRLQPDGRIIFAYQTVTSPGNRTVGIQNHDGTKAVLVCHDQERIHDGMTVHFVPGGPWWEIVPAVGSIPAGGQTTVLFRVSSTSMAPGTYAETVHLASNAVAAESIDIPLTLTVLANRAPVAMALTPEAFPEDTATAITLSANDSDEDPLTYRVVTPPRHGTLGGTAPALTYTPAADFHGSDTFTYVANDGQADSAPACVTLTVLPVNDAPVIVTTVADCRIDEDTTSAPILFTVSDIDQAPESLTVTARSSDQPLISDDRLVVARVIGRPDCWSVTATPLPDTHGTTDITLVVSDGSASGSRSFRMTVTPVNDAPHPVGVIADRTIAEDTTSQPILFQIADIDTSCQDVTVIATSSSQGVIRDDGMRLIRLPGTGDRWSLTITPVPDASGTATITLIMDDGLASGTSSFSVTVVPVNDPPAIIPRIADRSLVEDSTTPLLVPFSVVDIDTPWSQVVITASSSDQSIVSDDRLVVARVSGADNRWSLSATPVPDATGTTTITLVLFDGVDSGIHSFRLTVAPVNDPPSIVTTIPDRSIAEDTLSPPIAFTIADIDTPVADLTVTASSSSQDIVRDDGLTVARVAGTGNRWSLTAMPVPDAIGTTTITIEVGDGFATCSRSFHLTIVPVNDAPSIVSSIPDRTITEDTPGTPIIFAISDSDTPLASLTVTAISSSQAIIRDDALAIARVAGTDNRWSLTATPVPDATGTTTITIEVDDGSATCTRSFRLTVAPVNDAPSITTTIPDRTITEDTPGAPIIFAISDSDTPLASLTVTASSSSQAIIRDDALAIARVAGTDDRWSLTATPVPDATGTATITIEVDDGSATCSRSFRLTVAPVNDAPWITTAIPDRTITGDTPGAPIIFAIRDSDTPLASLTVTASSSSQALIRDDALAIARVAGTDDRWSLTATPVPGATGTTTITIEVDDGSAAGHRSFLVTVVPPNDPPFLAQPLAALAWNGSAPFSFVLPMSLFIDPDGDALTYSTGPLPPGIVFDPPSRTFTGADTAQRQAGVTTVTVTVEDGHGGTAQAMVTVTCEDPPQSNASEDDSSSSGGSHCGAGSGLAAALLLMAWLLLGARLRR